MKTNTTKNKRNFAPVAVWNGKEVYFIEDTPGQYKKPIIVPDLETWQKENAMKAAISTLQNVYFSTDDNKVKEMYYGLIKDQKAINNSAIVNYSVSDGYDVFIECYLYLKAMNSNGYWDLFTPDTIIITLRSGKKKPASLFQGICNKARSYIYDYGQTDFKRKYIEDLTFENKEGEKLNCYDALEGLLKVPQYFDIDSYNDYIVFMDFLKSLNLTTRQKQILVYRLKGKSADEKEGEFFIERKCKYSDKIELVQVSEIAKKLNVSQQAISKQLEKIQQEVEKKYPDMIRSFKGKRRSAKTK